MNAKVRLFRASLIAWIAAAVLPLIIWGPEQFVRAQQGGEDVESLQVRPNFYMISGAGGNIGVQIGSDGVVLVDTGTADAAGRVLAAIEKLTDQRIRYIINTGADQDHVGGNAKLSKAGRSIFATGTDPIGGEFGKAMTNNYAATILASENVLLRMSAPTGKASPYPNDAWPVETFAEKQKAIYLNHEAIEILRQPAAHSDSDSLVFFRASDVVAAGDIIDATRFPVIDLANGGGIQGEIDALNHVVELAIRPIPFIFSGGGTIVLPGRGRLYDKADAVEYRDMIVIVRDVIQDMLQRGMTLDQVKAAHPAEPYEPQYGAKSGPWTTDNFVEAVYKSLMAKK